MTPKKKAKELVERFIPYCTYDKGGLVTPVGKQCALIAVEEILEALKYDMNNPTSGSVKYWQQVKEEIEKI